MASRIARHRAERPPQWTTVEEPFDLVARLQKLEGTGDAFVVDCLTLWVANRLLRGDHDEAILDEADALGELIGRRRSSFTVVSNEVGEGVHPETAAGLRFRDLLGSVNQRVAAACDTVVLMVAGIPLTDQDAAVPASPTMTRLSRLLALDRAPPPDGSRGGRAPPRQPDEAAGKPGAARGDRPAARAPARRRRPRSRHPVIFTFAADHGVVAEGVSAYPQVVTAQMVENFLRGGAAVNVLARQAGARLVVADFGVAGPLAASPGLVACPIGPPAPPTSPRARR